MKFRGYFVFGKLAIFFTKLHYAREVRPYAGQRGHSREQILEAARQAHKRLFDEAWPEEKDENDMSVNLNEVAAAITRVEGLSDEQNITETKEFLAVLGLRWRGMSEADALAEFEAIRSRAGLSSTHAE